jgi:large subunit ribosomal protein L6
MSRIGKMPIPVPAGVQVDIDGSQVVVTGPKGTLRQTLVGGISVERAEDGTLTVVRPDDERTSRALHGLSRTLVANMVTGVTQGYEKKLEIVGVGWNAKAQGNSKVVLNIGFCHEVPLAMPEGVAVETPAATQIVLKGADKQAVGQMAARIRSVRPPEPYKGKGIRYAGEVVKRKSGKSFGS